MTGADDRHRREAAAQKAALEHARQRADERPDDAEAQATLGAALHHAGQLSEAESAWRRAVAADSASPLLHNNLGNVLADQGRLDEALAEYEQAVELAGPGQAPEAELNADLTRLDLDLIARPLQQALEAAQQSDDPDAHNTAAAALVAAGDIGTAIGVLSRTLEHDPGHLRSAVALGVIATLPLVVEDADTDEADRERRDIAENALNLLRQASLRHPGQASLQLHLGELLEALGRQAEARTALLRAIELDERNLEACDLASRYAKQPEAAAPFEDVLMEREDAARERYDDAPTAENALLLGIAKMALVRFQAETGAAAFQGARGALERALQLDESLAEAHRLLAWICERANALRRSLELLGRAAELSPDDARTQLDLARARMRLGLLDEALAAFSRARKLAPWDTAAALALQFAVQAVRRYRIAEYDYAREVRNGETPEALRRLIQAQVEALQLGPAMDNCERLIRMEPEALLPLLLAGRVAHRLGDLPGAETYLKKAVALAPDSADAHRQLGQLLAAQPGRMTEALRHLGEAQRLGRS